MVVQSRGAVIVVDDGGPGGEDLVERVQGVWPEVYRMTDHDEPNVAERVINVGSKHMNVKTLVRQMYEEQAYFAVVPNTLDPVRALSDLLSAARGYLADGFPAFVIVSGRPGMRYKRIATVLDPTEPITTGSLALAAVALAWRTGASVDALLLGGDPDNPPESFNDVRDMFRIEEGAELFQQADEFGRELGLQGTWRALGESASRDQLVLNAVRSGDYDLVVDDLRPIDVGPRIGRRKRVYRQLVDGDSIDTCYRLLRDAPCDVAVVVDAVRMRLVPPAYAKGAAVAALSIGLLGAAARPAAATSSSSSASTTSVEAPLDPSAETADVEQAATGDATAQVQTVSTTAPAGPAAPTGDEIPEEVTAEQMASYEQAAAQEQAALEAEQAELAALQQEQAAADAAVAVAQTDLAIAQQDLVEAQGTQEAAQAGLEYAEDARNTLTDEEVTQAKGSANRAGYDVDKAQQTVSQAEEALQAATTEATAAAEATAAQQAAVDAQAQNVNAWNASVAEADTRTDQRVSPVEGYSVTTSYGVAGSNWSSGYHTGSDYAAPSGTEVVAAASGTVTAAGYAGAYGNQVTIQHEDGTETTYAHLSSINVSVGDTVSAGEQIGAVGSTGNSTGPHLHFEAFDAGGERMNPEEWLAGA